ncbi:MAG: nicotinate-nucleotide adenylyltransferase [Betaproteobacteria bacterium]|nr:nicotinate-nucleotide adenylyltransferase [Betaproteobacteria bacterium]
MVTERFAAEVREPMSGPIGILGGSFDPVHHAHLSLAHAALNSLKLESVRWLPNGVPGHRGRPRAGAADRLAMLRLALQNESRFTIDESELWQAEPTFTINTLRRMRAEFGATLPMVFIIGADHLLGLHLWRDWEQLLDLAHFAIAGRPGYEIHELAMTPEVAAQYARRRAPAAAIAIKPGGNMVQFPFSPMAISSNSIRARIERESSIADLPRELPPAELLPELLPILVLDYIEMKRLYRVNA